MEKLANDRYFGYQIEGKQYLTKKLSKNRFIQMIMNHNTSYLGKKWISERVMVGANESCLKALSDNDFDLLVIDKNYKVVGKYNFKK